MNGVFRSPHAIGRDVKSYGCVVASRWAIDLIALPEPTARVHRRVGPHAQRQRQRMAKIDAFEHLVSILRGLRDVPVVVGGDFNEPKRFTATGLESFGLTNRDPGRTWIRAGKGATRTEATYAEWQRSVESVLGPRPEHGVRRVAPPDGLGVVTHVVGHGSDQGGRCFDHVLVSAHFDHPRLGVDDSVRSTADPKRRLSDHSIIWVDAEL